MTTLKRTLAVATLAAIAFAGCAKQDMANSDGSAASSTAASSKPSSPPSASASQKPTPTPRPSPTEDPSALKKGANHSNAASAWVYPAKDVHDWLHGDKEKSKTYPKDRKIAFLTFDDGPTARITPRVLDELKKAGVHASFYVIAGPQGLEGADPALLKRTIAEGHSVCIHTYSHKYGYLYPGGAASAENIVADYDKAVASVRKVLGPDFNVHCQRYPGGHGWKSMDAADEAMKAKGVYYLDWNSENGDGTDTAPTTGQGRADRALATLSGNPNVAVVLMHDHMWSDATADCIAPLVAELRARGYTFGTLD